jgi:hypothetical protein
MYTNSALQVQSISCWRLAAAEFTSVRSKDVDLTYSTVSITVEYNTFAHLSRSGTLKTVSELTFFLLLLQWQQ